MPDSTDNSAKAFQGIVRVLEEAVRTGVRPHAELEAAWR
jgi:hypothetical protein